MMKKLISMVGVLVVALGLSAGAMAATEQGSFTLQLTGCVSPTTAAVDYVKDLDTGYVTLHLLNATCASNNNITTLSGLPANLLPVDTYQVPVVFYNAGVYVPGQASFFSGASYISLWVWDGTRLNTTGWTGTKGFGRGIQLVYRSSP